MSTINKDRQKIKAFLTAEKNRVQEYADFLDVSVKSIYMMMNSPKEISNRELIAISSVFNISLSELGVDLTSEKRRKLEQRLQNRKKVDTNRIRSYTLWNEQEENKLIDRREFQKEYYQSVNEKIERTKQKLIIYDYFTESSQLSQGNRNCYYSGFAEYFTGLETHLFKSLAEGHNIKYERTMALPQEIAKHLSHAPRELILSSWYSLLFPETKNHLERIFSNKVGYSNYSIEVSIVPSRLFSIMILDEYLLTEVFRIKRDSVSVPDILLTENILHSPIAANMARVLESELENIRLKEIGGKVIQVRPIDFERLKIQEEKNDQNNFSYGFDARTAQQKFGVPSVNSPWIKTSPLGIQGIKGMTVM